MALKEPSDAPLIIPYASPEPRPEESPLVAMRKWRRRTGWGVAAVCVAVVVWWPYAVLACVFVLAAAILTLVRMFQYAASEMGTGYAVRHLILASLALPFMLLGVFLITRLVEADIARVQRQDLEP